LLNRYVDFDFSIDLKTKKVSFSREITKEGKSEKVEVSQCLTKVEVGQ
jgi:hypothetical protein